MLGASFMDPLMRRIAGIVVVLLSLFVAPRRVDAQAAPAKEDAIVVVGITPLRNGKYDPKRLREAKNIRDTIQIALQRKKRKVLSDDPKRLGNDFQKKFNECEAKEACVVSLLDPLRSRFTFAVYGDYQIIGSRYNVRLRLIDLDSGTVIKANDYVVAKNVIGNPTRWRKSLESAFAFLIEELPEPAEPTTEEPPTEQPPPTGPEGGEQPVGPVLDAIVIGPDEEDSFIDRTSIDAQNRGALWHGHFQQYFATGLRRGFANEFLIMEERLQLEFDAPVAGFRMIGRPQLVFDWFTKKIDPRFREVYATRQTDTFELSFGQRILTWGITDFWPVVDIINPRDFTTLRNWRPIDEKKPTPMLKLTLFSGGLSVEFLALPLLLSSSYILDRTKPFGLPIPQSAGGIAVDVSLQSEAPPPPSEIGGGIRIKYSIGDWAVSAYGLLARDVTPTAALLIANPVVVMPEVKVFNQRVIMGALSLQGSLDAIDTIIKTEAAVYYAVDDLCDGNRTPASLPGCTYLRRTPEARATLGFERKILSGLDAHLQLIAEGIRGDRIHKIPPRIAVELPGFEPQHALNPIATVRLQGQFRKNDFRPMLFAYWAYLDEELFVNLDLEYHIADGMALAVGGLWFEGYARKDTEKIYTLAGAQEKSSNVYLRATAWF